jgi:putative nucleotidyltransferase with HDIG domain
MRKSELIVDRGGFTRTPEGLPGVRMPIHMKIVLPYLFLSLVLAMGAAFLVTRIVFDSLEERFTNQLIESGKLASEWVFREEERMLASLRLLSNASGVPEAVQGRQAETLRDLMFGIVVDNREEAVEILDAEGNLLLSMRHRAGGNLEEYAFAKEGDGAFLHWDFIGKVVHQQPDGFSDKYSGLVRADWGDYFYIASPIVDPAGEQVGTILVGKSLASITKQIREETLAQVSLYDFAGNILYSTFSQPSSIERLLVTQVLANQDQSSLSRNLRDLQMANIDYQELVGPWEVRDNADIGVIGVSLPRAFYLSPNRVTRIQILLLVGVTFFFVIVMGASLARIITRPLITLVHASTQVSSGNLEIQVEPKSNDEVAVLTCAFNQMVSSLNASRSALLHAYDSTLEGWSKALELRDKETDGHTMRVARMTVEIARTMGVGEQDLVQIQRGALLHDIGKMGIPDAILKKPGKLTGEEWVVMRKHPEYAYEMLWPIEYLRPALDIPYRHHERWDGSGYPSGLVAEEIPFAARIFAVVDVWDALISDRPYKSTMERDEALAEILSQRGILFDPRVVDVFAAYIANEDTA